VQKVFLYDLKLIHNTDGRTDRQTYDNHANSSTVT